MNQCIQQMSVAKGSTKLLYVVLSVFPIINVPNRALFAAKIGGVMIGLNLAGALFYWRADTRRERAFG
jgi:hypothetical protein